MRTRPEYRRHLSDARRQLIQEARAKRDSWMRQARELREDGITPGLSLMYAQVWNRRLVMILTTANRRAS